MACSVDFAVSGAGQPAPQRSPRPTKPTNGWPMEHAVVVNSPERRLADDDTGIGHLDCAP
jgi:hypothetical protein